MRTRRSFLATSSSTPSSVPLRPILFASATASEYSAMSSGWVVRHHQHDELRALALFQRGQLGIELVDLLRAQRAGEIGDMPRERRNRGRRHAANAGAQQGDRQQQQQAPRCAHQSVRRSWQALAGLPPKSTVGAVEIAFSFSTVKFGLTL